MLLKRNTNPNSFISIITKKLLFIRFGINSIQLKTGIHWILERKKKSKEKLVVIGIEAKNGSSLSNGAR